MNFSMKKLRTKAGISRVDAARQLGVSVHTIRSWELSKSRPNLDMACEIAALLNCTLDELAGREWPELAYEKSERGNILFAYDSMNVKGQSELSSTARGLSSLPDNQKNQVSDAAFSRGA